MSKERNIFGKLVSVYGIYGLGLPEKIAVNETAFFPNLVIPNLNSNNEEIELTFLEEVEEVEGSEPIRGIRLELRYEKELVGTILSLDRYFIQNPAHLIYPSSVPADQYMSDTWFAAYVYATGDNVITAITNYSNREDTTIRVSTIDDLSVEIDNCNGTVNVDVPLDDNVYDINTSIARGSMSTVTVTVRDGANKSRFEYRNVEDVDDED